MKGIYHLLLLLVQVGLTFPVLLGVYLVLALLTYQGGFPAFVGLVAFQPVLDAIFSLVTIIICALVGLPLRLASFGNWWRQRSYLALAGVLTATGLLLWSLVVLRAAAPTASPEPAVLGLAGSGWFLLAFSLLHVFPPASFLRRVKSRTRWLGGNLSLGE